MYRSLVRNLGAGWTHQAISIAVAFFTMPVVVARLGPDLYGVWLFVVALLAYAELLHAGVGAAVVRGLAVRIGREDWEGLREQFSFSLYALGGLLVVALAACAALSLVALPGLEVPPEATAALPTVLVLVALYTATSFAKIPFGSVLWANERFDLVTLVSVGERLGFLAGVLWWLGSGTEGLVELAFLRLLLAILATVVSAALALPRIPPPRLVGWSRARRAQREVVGLSKWVFVAILAERVIYQTDVVVLGYLAAPAVIAVYGVAAALAEYVRGFLERVEVAMPTAAQVHGRGEGERLEGMLLFGGKASATLALLIAICLGVFGSAFLARWMGADFVAAAPIVQILLVVVVVRAPSMVAEVLLFGRGEVRLPTLLAVVEAIANLALSVLLCLHLGAIGVALGTAVPALVLWGAVFPQQVARRLGLPLRTLASAHFLRPLVVAAFPMAVALLASAWLEPSDYPGLALACAAVLLVGALCFYGLGLDPGERALLWRLLRRSRTGSAAP